MQPNNNNNNKQRLAHDICLCIKMLCYKYKWLDFLHEKYKYLGFAVQNLIRWDENSWAKVTANNKRVGRD